MELALNLAWLLLAIGMVCLWLRLAPRDAANQRTQFSALVVLIFVLLPAISMTDDLMAAQNPAEADCCLRRDHEDLPLYTVVPAVAALPLPTFTGLSCAVEQRIAAAPLHQSVADPPALQSVQNRPPPAA